MATQPEDDGALWFREDRIRACLDLALHSAVSSGGQPAKAVAWDVSHRFWSAIRGVASEPTERAQVHP